MFTSGILSVILIAQPAPLPKLVGMLSVTSGKVRLERSGRDPEWAGKYVRVRIGDTLTVVEKPTATLRIDLSRETFRLPEKGSWLVQERSLKVLEGAAPTLIHREAGRRQAPGAKPPTMAGRIRGGEGAVGPLGAVAANPVTITWTRAAGAKKAQVDLLDSAGKKTWSKDAGSAVSMALPSGPLKPGMWFQVRVVQSGAGNPSVASTWIRVLPAPEKSALEGSERSLRAALAEDSVALGEALGELWASAGMVSKLPEALKLVFAGAEWEKNPEALWRLGVWLEAAGFTGAARTEYERAWAAGGRDPELKESIERLGGNAELEDWEKLAAERDRLMAEGKLKEALSIAEQVVGKLRSEDKGAAVLGKELTFLGYVLLSLEESMRAEKVADEAYALLKSADWR
ncbi:MAG TPA: hypothetical protein PLO61_05700 [Fimbriimonadaceae bacterium]|nr:hypothetical protein [Fimbriimonadaceae bacterium]HRJ33387.1 hypothetical protein [Fimbriimonadaceae bacterium]